MSTNYLESSSVCIAQRTSKVPASAWPRSNALFTNTEGECGRRQNWTRAQPSISPSARENKRNQKVVKLRLEADHELSGTRHTVGGRQSGRYGSCPACAAAREVGEPYLRRARWRRGPGFSLLPGSVLGKIVRSSPQVGAAGFETAQSGWDGSAQTGQDRPSDQDHPSRHYDLIERRAGPGGQFQTRC